MTVLPNPQAPTPPQVPDPCPTGIHVLSTPGTTVVRLSGDIDLDRAADLDTALVHALAECEDGAGLALDMSEVTFCDSTGLNVLLRVRHEALAEHRPVTIVAAGGRVARLLDITGTGSLFGYPPPLPA
ncbi:STAS domain-containing protein [Streptomyces sp. NPDC003327]